LQNENRLLGEELDKKKLEIVQKDIKISFVEKEIKKKSNSDPKNEEITLKSQPKNKKKDHIYTKTEFFTLSQVKEAEFFQEKAHLKAGKGESENHLSSVEKKKKETRFKEAKESSPQGKDKPKDSFREFRSVSSSSKQQEGSTNTEKVVSTEANEKKKNNDDKGNKVGIRLKNSQALTEITRGSKRQLNQESPAKNVKKSSLGFCNWQKQKHGNSGRSMQKEPISPEENQQSKHWSSCWNNGHKDNQMMDGYLYRTILHGTNEKKSQTKREQNSKQAERPFHKNSHAT
jgi:hypothetical protein